MRSMRVVVGEDQRVVEDHRDRRGRSGRAGGRRRGGSGSRSARGFRRSGCASSSSTPSRASVSGQQPGRVQAELGAVEDEAEQRRELVGDRREVAVARVGARRGEGGAQPSERAGLGGIAGRPCLGLLEAPAISSRRSSTPSSARVRIRAPSSASRVSSRCAAPRRTRTAAFAAASAGFGGRGVGHRRGPALVGACRSAVGRRRHAAREPVARSARAASACDLAAAAAGVPFGGRALLLRRRGGVCGGEARLAGRRQGALRRLQRLAGRGLPLRRPRPDRGRRVGAGGLGPARASRPRSAAIPSGARPASSAAAVARHAPRPRRAAGDCDQRGEIGRAGGREDRPQRRVRGGGLARRRRRRRRRARGSGGRARAGRASSPRAGDRHARLERPAVDGDRGRRRPADRRRRR